MSDFSSELAGALAEVEHATASSEAAVAATVKDMESDNGHVDEDLVQKYSELMQEYVRRKTQKLLLDRLASRGELTVPSADDPGVEAARAERRERHQQVLSKLMATFDELQNKAELVKIQQAALRAQKQDLLERADEFRRAQEDRREAELFGRSPFSLSPEDSSPGSGVSGLDDDDDDVEELNQEGERLLAIQQRSAELQAQIEKYKSKNLKLSRALQAKSDNLPPEVRDCLNDEGQVTESTKSAITTLLHELKDQNAQMEAKIEQHREMTEFYTGMRECLEELRGVRVLYVKDASLPSTRVARRQALKCAFVLLDKYELEVELQSLDSPRGRANKAADEPPQQLVPVKAAFRNLDLSLDDLVVSAKPSSVDHLLYPNGADRLRRIVTEALARIHLEQQRALHLEQLQAMPGIEVAVARRSPGDTEGERENAGNSRADEQWVCRILHDADSSSADLSAAATGAAAPAVAGWVALLSLTPDCPIIPGSVRLAQLHYLNNEGVEVKHANLSDALIRINEVSYASPIELVVQLVEELRG